jgi:hypothetical protein
MWRTMMRSARDLLSLVRFRPNSFPISRSRSMLHHPLPPMSDVDRLVAYIRRTLTDLNGPPTDAAYEYASLPLCVIDAVFSIGVRYESTERTVTEFCGRYRWQRDGRGRTAEHPISDFLVIVQPYENRWEDMADRIFRNRQRTSSRSGILKAEATFRFAKTLQHFGLETFADVLKSGLRNDLRQAIKAIPGQSSGLSYAYFLILAGNQDGVKADRMVTRYVANALGVRNVAPELAEELVRNASKVLRAEFPRLVPSSLDNKIWKYQRAKEDGPPATCRP